MNENHVSRIAKLEITQARLLQSVNVLQKFVTELSNGAAAIVEQQAPHTPQTVSGTAAALAVVTAVARVAAPAGEDAAVGASPAPAADEENKPLSPPPGLLPVVLQQDRLPKL